MYIRARIMLLAERTANAAAIARALGIHARTVRKILRRGPAEYGGDDGRWTLEQAALALARELGLESVSTETVRLLLKRRHHSWQRAKERIRSPDPRYARKKVA